MSWPGTLCPCAAHRGQMLHRAQPGPPLCFEVPCEPDLLGNQSSCGVSNVSRQAAALSRCQTPTLHQPAVGLVSPRWVGTLLPSPCCHHPVQCPPAPFGLCHPAQPRACSWLPPSTDRHQLQPLQGLFSSSILTADFSFLPQGCSCSLGLIYTPKPCTMPPITFQDLPLNIYMVIFGTGIFVFVLSLIFCCYFIR